MVLKIRDLWTIIGIVSAAVRKSVIVNDKITSIWDLDNYLVYTDISKLLDWVYQVILETL
jgi:hypothetical protein